MKNGAIARSRKYIRRMEIHVKKMVRCRTPAQHARLMALLKDHSWSSVLSCNDVQRAFDEFYFLLLKILDTVYPMHSVTTASRDPCFVTPYIKALLRKKNKLMRRGEIAKAEAIVEQVRNEITKSTSKLLNIGARPNRGTRALWEQVRSITGGGNKKSTLPDTLEEAEVLNSHFAQMSTDHKYLKPTERQAGDGSIDPPCEIITEQKVFHMLDRLKSTSMGFDGLPAWFLRLSAPSIALPLAYLYNLSISQSKLPNQWRAGVITPVPKITRPTSADAYRPITVTPILSRLLERIVVRDYIYPIFTSPECMQKFSDQFAFRPTGSTTAALIAIWHKISNLLQTHA